MPDYSRDHFHCLDGSGVNYEHCEELTHCPSFCDHTSENCDVEVIDIAEVIDATMGLITEDVAIPPTKLSFHDCIMDGCITDDDCIAWATKGWI